MRIALVTPVYAPYASGMARAAEMEARYLASEGHGVTVCTPRYSAAHLSSELAGGVAVRRLTPLVRYGNAAVVLQLLWQMGAYDAVHLHYPFIGGALWTVWGVWLARARGRRVKMLVTYHMDLVGKGAFRPLFALMNRTVLPMVLRASDRVRVSSMEYAMHSRYAKYFLRYKEKVIAIPFGVDTEVFTPHHEDVRRAPRVHIAPQEGERVILFVGALDRAHYFKGLPVLFRALKEYLTEKNIQLVVAGDGNARTEYEGLAYALKLGERVRFAGYVPARDLPSLYASAEVFVLPSIDLSEAYGIATAEAQSCGTPAVVSDLPGVRSVISAGRTGLLSRAGDAKSVAEAIRRIIYAEDYPEWRMRAREWAAAHLSAAHEKAELLKVYNSL